MKRAHEGHRTEPQQDRSRQGSTQTNWQRNPRLFLKQWLVGMSTGPELAPPYICKAIPSTTPQPTHRRLPAPPKPAPPYKDPLIPAPLLDAPITTHSSTEWQLSTQSKPAVGGTFLWWAPLPLAQSPPGAAAALSD